MYRGLLFGVLDVSNFFSRTSLEIIVVLHKAPTFRGHDDDDWSTMGGTAHIRREAKANREADKASLAAQKAKKAAEDARYEGFRKSKHEKRQKKRRGDGTRRRGCRSESREQTIGKVRGRRDGESGEKEDVFFGE